MKKFLVGKHETEGTPHFIAPFAVIESESARDAVRTYNESFNYQSGEVMCIIDKKTDRPAHLHKDTDVSDCLSVIESCNIINTREHIRYKILNLHHESMDGDITKIRSWNIPELRVEELASIYHVYYGKDPSPIAGFTEQSCQVFGPADNPYTNFKY